MEDTLVNEHTVDFLDVHRNVLTYDAVSPLAQDERYLDLMIDGGLNVVAATILSLIHI